MTATILEIPGGGSFRLMKALVGFKADLEHRLRRFPYEKNVFLMLKYRPANRPLSDFMEEVLSQHGFRGVRADHPDWNITGNVYNPLAALYCCKYGIALFDEPEMSQSYSANVAYELGIMHYQEKRCLILRHSSLPSLPFDLIKDLVTAYSRDLEVRSVIQSWVGELASAVPDQPHREPDASQVSTTLSRPGSIATEVVVSDVGKISAAAGSVAILLRKGSYWRLSWKVSIQNLTRGEAHYYITVQYLDSNGHCLESQPFAPPASLSPTQLREFSESTLIDHELAQQVASAIIYVSLA
jgi:hypothetical protein